jgi:hypothetical protein
VNDAVEYRVNPRLLAATFAAIVLLTAVLLVVSQQSLIHAINGMLQGPQEIASYCGAVPTPC